jgi:hypothetical protein
MEQRPLRLGDIVDDYCPRERRLTNHAIVAIVGDSIRQTRCTTCDADHPYKQGREPRRRKKGDESLFDQVLADVAEGQLVAPKPAVAEPAPATDAGPRPAAAAAAAPAPAVTPEADEAESAQPEPGHDAGHDHWPAHRRLIRAALPKTEGELPPPRPIPEFTMHQRQYGRGGRPDRFGGPERNGNVAGGNSRGDSWSRGGHGHGGAPRGDGHGQGPGPGGGRPGRRRGRHKRAR